MSYFEAHCLPVAEAARRDARVLQDVATLVLLSIQQPWQGMPAQFAHVRAHGAESVYLFGAKRLGYAYVGAYSESLRQAAIEAHAENDLDALIMRYLDVPNLGLAKASFLAQMTMGDGACLDVHNLRHLGLSETAMRLSKKLTDKSKLAKVSAYNSAWRPAGDSAHWWDSWCDYLATRTGRYGNRFNTGFEVSAVHTLPIL